ncbi:MAG TPA: GntR family transcriptional regulator [Vicinamibacterales bacterium]
MSPWEGFAIDQRDATPLHAQLERGILAAIAAGRLRRGDQLPTVRQLAVDLRVNANTVAKVYAHLERGGVLETRRGVGTFVALPGDRAPDPTARQSELHRLIDRFLAELSTHGFSVDDALPEIEARRQQGA